MNYSRTRSAPTDVEEKTWSVPNTNTLGHDLLGDGVMSQPGTTKSGSGEHTGQHGTDDSLDVFGVHAVGGIIGALLTGVFAAESFGGVGLAEGVSIGGQVSVQFIGVIATVIYTAVASFIILKVIDAVMGLRVNDDQETEGLDLALHDERGYNL